MTNTARQFQADLVIQRKQYNDLHAVVTKGSERKSAKRQSLDGQHLFTQLEFVDKFAKQAVRKARKKDKGTKQKKKSTPENDE